MGIELDPTLGCGAFKLVVRSTLRAGERAEAVMSLTRSTQLNGHEPFACREDVLNRLPTQRQSEIGALLPHRWELTA